LNPAVTFGGGIAAAWVLEFIAAAWVLEFIAGGNGADPLAGGLATNGYGAHSPGLAPLVGGGVGALVYRFIHTGQRSHQARVLTTLRAATRLVNALSRGRIIAAFTTWA
jgi:hypothetical protein